jgi:hypothetical protein
MRRVAMMRADIPADKAIPLALLMLLAVWTVVAPAPWISAGDSGELSAAAWNLGVPHNPGYPLFLLLAKAFATVLPLGSVALRVALFSGLGTLAAAGVLLLVLLPHLVGGDRTATAAGSLFVAVALLSGRYRSLFREGEVYGIALALLIVLTAAVIPLSGTGRRHGPILGLLAGIAVLGHYQAGISLIFVAAAWLLLRPRGEGIVPIRYGLGFLAAALATLPVLLYLPLRSAGNPLPDWGNPQSWGNFLFHVGGGEHFGTKLGIAESGQRLIRFAGEAVAPWGWWSLASVLGLLVVWRRGRGGALLVAVAAGEAFYAIALNRVEPVITPFLPLTGLLMAVLAGIGLAAVARRAGRLRHLAVGAVLLIPVTQVLFSPPFWDRDLPSDADSYAQIRTGRLAARVPPGGIAVVSGDSTAFPLVYLQGVGQARPDLLVIDRTNSAFSYPGWSPAKIDGDSRREIEDLLLGQGRPVIALGFTGTAEFGSRRGGDPESAVSFTGAALSSPLPDPFTLVGLPSGGMTRRTVAEGVFLALGEMPGSRPDAVTSLQRIARWGEQDPYLLNESGIRLFRAGEPEAAVQIFRLGAQRFPDYPAFERNISAIRGADRDRD